MVEGLVVLQPGEVRVGDGEEIKDEVERFGGAVVEEDCLDDLSGADGPEPFEDFCLCAEEDEG